ncbi:magnesium transporter CorA family protein [Acinetobacter sp. MD2]|uniref:magnesium transporter CorA family protein n=1 Tax=Acinetobacter sp. MD2 TaxID=2600066 RepID=UPI002D1EE3D5|nr:magnesium transporter CorA family protein [Acinetobacter sp. MD2]MEB3767004.1 magnesium transporter CorA family protein [Acinetobacter sp. MD2]
MQVYYFYRHPDEDYTFIRKAPAEHYILDYIWVDCLRQDVVGQEQQWQEQIQELTHLHFNEFHLQDILNLDHPCGFDTMDDYDFLIFRKLITPDDHVAVGTETHHSEFGLLTTPVNFILSPRAIVTVREQGNQAIENYIERLHGFMQRPEPEQNKTRKLPATPLNLAMRLLNSMIDDYLQLRAPLTRRVEYWQQELLQGHRYFRQWRQLLQENMAFQQVENLCEEQIETLQELRDEIVENYHHLVGNQPTESLDLMLVRLNDLVSHIERIQKHTARLRSSIQAAIDLHFSAISNQTNENMRILAIITAVFAPLTLLTGIYGMNFEFIPGLKSPQGFWLMLVVMLFSTALLIFYFYRRHMVGRGENSVIDMLAQQHHQKGVNLFWFLDIEPIKQTLKQVEKMTKLK